MRDELHPDHLGGDLLRFLGRFGKLNAAAFPAAAGVDLCLYDDDVGAEFASSCLGLFGRAGDNAPRNGNAIFLQ